MKTQKFKLSQINHDVNNNFVLCSIVLKDGSVLKEKFIGYRLSEAKKRFLITINSL
jgi:hypothetical protein